ncbi:MAG: cytochrome d ubiquinol oxidase subunit II [Hyphomicrobiales bacterium]|nr:cytochrome d ubiquinol oxidase subunit II [Hyphomicrobiales bacterium]
MTLDYDTLRVIWWALLGVLLIGFAVMDGFDLGIAALIPFLGRADGERRLLINAIGPTWEGNQVWFILGGGASFAAWPPLYATSFSGFYLAMLLVLMALILRPVAFKYRSKLEDRRWRRAWDIALCVGGVVPALVFGVAFGNLLQGAPFSLDHELRSIGGGSLLALLNPFALLCGLVSLSMLMMHGAAYAAVKTSGPVADRSRYAGGVLALVTFVLFALGGVAIARWIHGYTITSAIAANGPSDPTLKTVASSVGGWMASYSVRPWTMAAPALGLAGPVAVFFLLRLRADRAAFVASAISVAAIIATAGLATFPFLLPSSTAPDASLTVWDASSSETTLFVMLIATAIFLPIVLAYTAWVYRVLRGRVEPAHIESNKQAY